MDFKTIVKVVILRPDNKGDITIHTEVFQGPKNIFDRTYDLCGVAVKTGEKIVEVAIKACQKQLGNTRFGEHSLANNGLIKAIAGYATFIDIEGKSVPVYCVHIDSAKGIICVTLLAKVSFDFDARVESKSHVIEHKWWTPDELLSVLQMNPERFPDTSQKVFWRLLENIRKEDIKLS